MKYTMRMISVEGLNLERLIRQATENNIELYGLKRKGRRLNALVKEQDIQTLTSIVDSGGWHIIIGRRRGLGRCLETIQRHWLLCAFMFVCIAAVYICSQIVWNVSISNAGVYESDAKSYLSQLNIHIPAWKQTIELEELNDLLEWRYPDIAWIECGWRGTSLQITFVQGVPQGKKQSYQGAGDVIATRGGIVDSVLTTAGTAAVAPGDVIRKGQILIKGYERSAEEEQHIVQAGGIVMARVWECASVRMSLNQLETEYSGREYTTWTVATPYFDLWRHPESAFSHQDTRRYTIPLGGLFLPFTVRIEQNMEVELTQHARSLPEVKQEAGEAAWRLLKEKTGFSDDLVDKWVDYCMIEDEILEAVAYGERLVNVAAPINNMQ